MGYILSESEFRETVAFEMVNRVGFKKNRINQAIEIVFCTEITIYA